MLTPKQEKFCQCIVSGMSGRDSYLTAYANNSNANTAYKESMKLLDRSDIQDKIKELRKPLELQAKTQALSERESKRELIKSRIQACVAREDDAAASRWMDILNKMDAEYININRNIDTKDAEIIQLDVDTLKAITTA